MMTDRAARGGVDRPVDGSAGESGPPGVNSGPGPDGSGATLEQLALALEGIGIRDREAERDLRANVLKAARVLRGQLRELGNEPWVQALCKLLDSDMGISVDNRGNQYEAPGLVLTNKGLLLCKTHRGARRMGGGGLDRYFSAEEPNLPSRLLFSPMPLDSLAQVQAEGATVESVRGRLLAAAGAISEMDRRPAWDDEKSLESAGIYLVSLK